MGPSQIPNKGGRTPGKTQTNRPRAVERVSLQQIHMLCLAHECSIVVRETKFSVMKLDFIIYGQKLIESLYVTCNYVLNHSDIEITSETSVTGRIAGQHQS